MTGGASEINGPNESGVFRENDGVSETGVASHCDRDICETNWVCETGKLVRLEKPVRIVEAVKLQEPVKLREELRLELPVRL